MAETVNYPTMLHDRAHNLLRVQGILSIVFGSLGIAAGIFLALFFIFTVTDYNAYQVSSALVMAALVFIFGVLPHIYLLVAGIVLLRQPTPAIAKTLVIINLIVGILWNLVIMVFAIINLTQLADYERGYKK